MVGEKVYPLGKILGLTKQKNEMKQKKKKERKKGEEINCAKGRGDYSEGKKWGKGLKGEGEGGLKEKGKGNSRGKLGNGEHLSFEAYKYKENNIFVITNYVTQRTCKLLPRTRFL